MHSFDSITSHDRYTKSHSHTTTNSRPCVTEVKLVEMEGCAAAITNEIMGTCQTVDAWRREERATHKL